jgi:hypothetical protein
MSGGGALRRPMEDREMLKAMNYALGAAAATDLFVIPIGLFPIY